MTRTIAIIGGKGGIGKSTLASNLSCALAQLGASVIAIDANLTTPNLGIHLGIHLTPNSLHSLLKGESTINNSIYPYVAGFKVIPGSMNIYDLKDVDAGRLPEVALALTGKSDFILIDSAAGLGREALSAINAADEILIITNPELPSVVDALRTIKIAENLNKKILGVVVNRVTGKWHELKKREIEEMLGLPVLVEIPEDENMAKSVTLKIPLVMFNPISPASIEIRRLAHLLIGKEFKEEIQKPQGLLERIVKWILGK